MKEMGALESSLVAHITINASAEVRRHAMHMSHGVMERFASRSHRRSRRTRHTQIVITGTTMIEIRCLQSIFATHIAYHNPFEAGGTFEHQSHGMSAWTTQDHHLVCTLHGGSTSPIQLVHPRIALFQQISDIRTEIRMIKTRQPQTKTQKIFEIKFTDARVEVDANEKEDSDEDEDEDEEEDVNDTVAAFSKSNAIFSLSHAAFSASNTHFSLSSLEIAAEDAADKTR